MFRQVVALLGTGLSVQQQVGREKVRGKGPSEGKSHIPCADDQSRRTAVWSSLQRMTWSDTLGSTHRRRRPCHCSAGHSCGKRSAFARLPPSGKHFIGRRCLSLCSRCRVAAASSRGASISTHGQLRSPAGLRRPSGNPECKRSSLREGAEVSGGTRGTADRCDATPGSVDARRSRHRVLRVAFRRLPVFFRSLVTRSSDFWSSASCRRRGRACR